MQRLLSRSSVRVAVAVLVLAGCGGDDGSGTDPVREMPVDTGRPDRIVVRKERGTVELPLADPLSEDSATTALRKELSALDDGSRQLLLYLARLGDRTAITRIREQMLAKDGNEYVDEWAAAVGIEALLEYGEPDAPGLAIDLARFLLDEEDMVDELTAAALARVEGERRPEAEELLLRIAEGDDDDAALVAVEALVRRRVENAAPALGRIAADAQNQYDTVRAAAITGLLRLGDPRAKALADAITSADTASSEVIDGFAIPGAIETLPYVRKVVDDAFEAGDATLEFTQACYTLMTIYEDGGGNAAREMISGWLTRDPELDDDEAALALWALGDDSRKPQVAEVLVRQVAYYAAYDPELAVDVLDVIAKRGVADDPAFRNAVAAAAQVEPPENAEEGLVQRVRVLNAAAAHAFLRSQR